MKEVPMSDKTTLYTDHLGRSEIPAINAGCGGPASPDKGSITIGALVQAAESAYTKTHPAAPTPFADFAAAIRHECDNAPGSLSRWAMAEALEQIAEELKNTAAERD